MNGSLDQDVRLVNGACPVMRGCIVWVRMYCSRPPRVFFAIDERESGIADTETAIFIDHLRVRWRCDVEGFNTNYRAPFKVESPGYQR